MCNVKIVFSYWCNHLLHYLLFVRFCCASLKSTARNVARVSFLCRIVNLYLLVWTSCSIHRVLLYINFIFSLSSRSLSIYVYKWSRSICILNDQIVIDAEKNRCFKYKCTYQSHANDVKWFSFSLYSISGKLDKSFPNVSYIDSEKSLTKCHLIHCIFRSTFSLSRRSYFSRDSITNCDNQRVFTFVLANNFNKQQQAEMSTKASVRR